MRTLSTHLGRKCLAVNPAAHRHPPTSRSNDDDADLSRCRRPTPGLPNTRLGRADRPLQLQRQRIRRSAGFGFCFAKIAQAGSQLFSGRAKIRREISKQRKASLLQSRLAELEMIKMLLAHELEETTPNHRAEPVEIWKARKFIEEHSADELSLSKLAKAVNISANHLSEKFKQVTGVKFVDYVAQIRFEKARHLLLNSNLRISEIAFAVGFQSLSQFNRVFKGRAGKSPTEYRGKVSNALKKQDFFRKNA
jgi:AraC-like DNA-binding protein